MAENLVLNEKMSDVVLKVRHGGYSWRFPGHSLLLNARSRVLRDILEDRAADIHPAPVTIVGLEPETVVAILRYIYSGELPTKVTANLLAAADKYGLEALRDHLEEMVLPDLTVQQACQMLEGFEHEHPINDDCAVKTACFNVLESHAFSVFASDLVLSLSKNTLLKLLESDRLNVPDESVVFWGLWRWGLYHSSRNGRTLESGNVTSYIQELLCLIRVCGLRKRDGIPECALQRFNRCSGRRSRYSPPEDTIRQSSTLRMCGTWDEITDAIIGEEGNLCIQVSFDKDVMLVGITLEACSSEKIIGHLRIFEESSGKELLRQEINCGRFLLRKLSRTQEPESWVESDVVLTVPLILRRSEICSIYLQISGTPWALPRATTRPRRRKVDSTFAQIHGQSVSAIRELHLVPDMTVNWGSRR